MKVVKFRNVGRNKLNFDRMVPEMTHECMENALRSAPGLAIMSRDVEFVCSNEEQTAGSVVVGGFRSVGEWSVLE